MSYLIQNLLAPSILVFFLLMILTACSVDQHYKRQANGKYHYLDTMIQPKLKSPLGIIMPLQNNTYAVCVPLSNGKVGKEVDIRPPAQIFALLKDSRGRFVKGVAIIFFKSTLSFNNLWKQVIQIVRKLEYPIVSCNDAVYNLTTNWIHFYRSDEDIQYQGCYQISMQPKQNCQVAVIVKTLNLKRGSTEITEELQIQRYAVYVLNSLVYRLEQY